MMALSVALLAVITGLMLVQLVVVLRLRRALRKDRPAPSDSTPWPRATIVLALRGTDPFLADSMQGLLDQDYPDFEIHVVVDRPGPCVPGNRTTRSEDSPVREVNQDCGSLN